MHKYISNIVLSIFIFLISINILFIYNAASSITQHLETVITHTKINEYEYFKNKFLYKKSSNEFININNNQLISKIPINLFLSNLDNCIFNYNTNYKLKGINLEFYNIYDNSTFILQGWLDRNENILIVNRNGSVNFKLNSVRNFIPENTSLIFLRSAVLFFDNNNNFNEKLLYSFLCQNNNNIIKPNFLVIIKPWISYYIILFAFLFIINSKILFIYNIGKSKYIYFINNLRKKNITKIILILIIAIIIKLCLLFYFLIYNFQNTILQLLFLLITFEIILLSQNKISFNSEIIYSNLINLFNFNFLFLLLFTLLNIKIMMIFFASLIYINLFLLLIFYYKK